MRFAGAMLFVKDLDRMTAFYRDVVGLKPVAATRSAEWVEFEAAGGDFALHAIPAPLAEDIEIASPPKPREQQSCKLVFEVEDVDAELARLTGLGVLILHRPWGAWDMVDPEGNVLGVRPARG